MVGLSPFFEFLSFPCSNVTPHSKPSTQGPEIARFDEETEHSFGPFELVWPEKAKHCKLSSGAEVVGAPPFSSRSQDD